MLKTEARKVMVDFKFHAQVIDRESPEVGLVEKLSGSLYWWVELCVPILHRESTALSDIMFVVTSGQLISATWSLQTSNRFHDVC